MAGASHITTDHDTIRHWVEARGGKPVSVHGLGGDDDPGILRVDFPGYHEGEESLELITWDDFFSRFEKRQLAFLYRERSRGGEMSRFFKFVRRHEVH